MNNQRYYSLSGNLTFASLKKKRRKKFEKAREKKKMTLLGRKLRAEQKFIRKFFFPIFHFFLIYALENL